MEIACVVGFKPFEFWDLTPKELQITVDGYNKREEAKWERVRWGAYYAVLPTQAKGFKIDKIWLPIDAAKDADFKTHGKVERLNRKQLEDTWRKSGLKLSDDQLNRIFKDGKK